MTGLQDLGFFRKKNDSITNNSEDFRNTLGNCKHYGAKFLDCFGIVAGGLFVIPLIINVFSRNNNNNYGDNYNNGRPRKR